MNSHAQIEGNITPDNVAFYQQNGFVLAPQLFSEAEIDDMMAEALKIFRGEYGHVDGLQETRPGESEAETLGRYNAIHFPHKLSPRIRNQYLGHPKITDILTRIISPNVKCMQSMLFIKAPGKPGQSWHQDEYYIPTRDRSLTGVWIALHDADEANGCLWVIPRSQQPGYLLTRIPYQGQEYGDHDVCDIDRLGDMAQHAQPVPVPKGGVIFFNGYLLHSSKRNSTEQRFRPALVNHYMAAESLLPWDWDGRIPLSHDMRDIVMVAGEDPYAHKGTEDITYPYLRFENYGAVREQRV